MLHKNSLPLSQIVFEYLYSEETVERVAQRCAGDSQRKLEHLNTQILNHESELIEKQQECRKAKEKLDNIFNQANLCHAPALRMEQGNFELVSSLRREANSRLTQLIASRERILAQDKLNIESLKSTIQAAGAYVVQLESAKQRATTLSRLQEQTKRSKTLLLQKLRQDEQTVSKLHAEIAQQHTALSDMKHSLKAALENLNMLKERVLHSQKTIGLCCEQTMQVEDKLRLLTEDSQRFASQCELKEETIKAQRHGLASIAEDCTRTRSEVSQLCTNLCDLVVSNCQTSSAALGTYQTLDAYSSQGKLCEQEIQSASELCGKLRGKRDFVAKLHSKLMQEKQDSEKYLAQHRIQLAGLQGELVSTRNSVRDKLLIGPLQPITTLKERITRLRGVTSAQSKQLEERENRSKVQKTESETQVATSMAKLQELERAVQRKRLSLSSEQAKLVALQDKLNKSASLSAAETAKVTKAKRAQEIKARNRADKEISLIQAKHNVQLSECARTFQRQVDKRCHREESRGKTLRSLRDRLYAQYPRRR